MYELRQFEPGGFAYAAQIDFIEEQGSQITDSDSAEDGDQLEQAFGFQGYNDGCGQRDQSQHPILFGHLDACACQGYTNEDDDGTDHDRREDAVDDR